MKTDEEDVQKIKSIARFIAKQLNDAAKMDPDYAESFYVANALLSFLGCISKFQELSIAQYKEVLQGSLHGYAEVTDNLTYKRNKNVQ